MRRLLYLGIVILAACASAWGVRSWNPHAGGATKTVPLPAVERPLRVQFRDVAAAAGIRFHHLDSPSERHYVPEIMGGGAAWLDYDQDGYYDLFLVQGGKFPPDPNEKPAGPSSRLFRNQGDGTFADVTEQVGIWHRSFGQGVAVGDYDNDGYPDLFVACFGHGHLYHNEPAPGGGRRFREVTAEAGIRADGWCSSCAFADLHGNGHLDLIVGRYVKLDLAHYPHCGPDGMTLIYSCGPKEFHGQRSLLYRNNGDGTFTDISESAGLGAEDKALGVLVLDFDDDGKPDLFIGNDEIPNSHYRNLGGGKFQSCAVLSGTAVNWQGRPMGSMGVDGDDLTGDGKPDLFITTFYHEGTLLFRNNGKNLFTDVSQGAGMYAHSLNYVGWGTGLLDVDRDGALDIVVVNGHVYRNAHLVPGLKTDKGEPHSYKQPAQIFQGDGKGRFQPFADPGPYFKELHVGRGLALGDYDNDGHMDVAINNCGEDAALLHNETETPHHWIRLQLEGTRHTDPAGSNRDAIGAKVTLTVGGKTVVRYVKGGGSYYSSHERRLLIGLGEATQVDELEVRWPNAKCTNQRLGPLKADRNYKLVEGAATAVDAHCPKLVKVGERQ